MKKYLLPLFVFAFISLHAQTDVRAWPADGQVWIVWKFSLPLPLTVGVYASPNAFTNTAQATLIGRPFNLDYIPTALKEQYDTSATYRIPDGSGGVYQLKNNEALFVFTPHASGSLYFAVVPWEETQITPGESITDDAVLFTYDPIHDPVECHVQSVFKSPFEAGYTCFAMYMWVDGRDNYRDSRPDFPVMANAAKNGMAGFFFISMPNDLDTTQLFPLSIWLHGGGGTARQSLAGSRPIIGIDPAKGILVAHNDDVFGSRGNGLPFTENPSLHFGWRQHWDPFEANNFPTGVDTIINYTQRRYLWIDQWLIRHFNIDTNSIHIHGHSMGSWGSTALAKAYPMHYATATIFNNGFRGPDPGMSVSLFGETADNFPTNLVNRNGETVHYHDLFDLTTNISGQRDLPLFHSYHAKNDIGEANYWGVDVVNNYIAADSEGFGMALYWSEREHGVDTGPDHNDHWVDGNDADMQTNTDNVDYNETLTRSDISYPAFFNHRLDPNANDPGDGTPGTGINGVGDDWGTWGGWHRWDNASLVDEPARWSVEAWLESNAVFNHDNCPNTQLTADLAIRRSVHFKPQTGTMLRWRAEDVNTGVVLQSGNVIVHNDDLVVVPGIILYPENVRRVRITIEDPALATHEITSFANDIYLFPNPATHVTTVNFKLTKSASVRFEVFDSMGSLKLTSGAEQFSEGLHQKELDVNNFSPGFYFLKMQIENVITGSKFIVEE